MTNVAATNADEQPSSPDTSAVPEPTTLALVGSGLLGFVLLRRRRASRNSG